MSCFWGIDIGGTKIAVVLGSESEDGGIVVHARRETPTRDARDPKTALSRIVELARETVAATGTPPHQVAAAGISCGGPLDAERGLILSPPNLPGWDRIPIVRELESALGVPVRLMNDADAGAVAEHRYGAGRGCRHLVFLTFGTGIGAGLILNGELYTGASGGAGEIGHVRLAEWGPPGHGKCGSVEGFASGGGISALATLAVAAARQRGGASVLLPLPEGELTAKVVFDAAAAGDALARSVVETAGEQLGRALAILVDVLSPEVIILGGIFGRAEKLLRPPLERTLEREALPANAAGCRVVKSALGERIGDCASICVAMEAIGERS